MTQYDAPAPEANQPEMTGFTLALKNFEGPLDLLLQLISAKKMDVTEVALAEVTDEFISYTRALGETANLDEITEFVLIAATLLDLKTARLLPRGEADEIEDLELLETRDLLFARLLQYKAYKQVADLFAQWQAAARRRYPRAVSLEPQFAQLLPPVRLSHNSDTFAELAATVFRPKRVPEVGTSHLHQAAVSVPEQAGKLLEALRQAGKGTWVSFQTLTKDCEVSMEVIGRFLALLELYKVHAVGVDQVESLGELRIAWTGVNVDPAVVAASDWE